MGVSSISWASQTPLTGSRKWVLIALANYADDVDGYCFPGQRTLADFAGISERTVREQLAELERDGWIERAHRMRDGWRTSDEYVVRFDRFTPAPKERRTLRRDLPVGAADSVRSTGETRRTEPSVELPVIHQTRDSADASRETSLPGLEEQPRAKVTIAVRNARKDVARLVVEGANLFAAIDEKATADARAVKIAQEILDVRRTTPDEVIGMLRFALADDFWCRVVISWPKLRDNFVALRQKASTQGPGEALTPDRGAGGSPDLAVYFSGSFGDQQREALLLSRSIDPSRFWDDGRDQEALLRLALATTPTYPVGSREHHELVLAWQFRGEGQTLRGAVAAWEPVRV